MPSESTYSKYIWDYFMDIINNEYGVAGLMGNLYAESGLIPNNLQNDYEGTLGYTNASYTAAVDSGAYSKDSFVHDSAGYGLAQWTFSSRKKALYEYWQDGGYDSIGDIQLACDFLMYELENDFNDVLVTLITASSVREASDKVLHDFENPLNQSTSVEEKRAAYGQDYYNLYSGSTPDTPEPDEPEPDEPEPDIPVNVARHKMSLLLMILATRR